jgi:hypothetical protein
VASKLTRSPCPRTTLTGASLLVPATPSHQPAMANPPTGPFSLKELLYMLNHVFLPPKLPQEDDTETDCDIALCCLVYQASREFTSFLSQPQQRQWSIVIEMLKTLLKTTQALDKDALAENILCLEDGGQSFGLARRLLIIPTLDRSSCTSHPCSKCCSYSTQASRFYGF